MSARPSKLKAVFCQVWTTLNANIFKALSKLRFTKPSRREPEPVGCPPQGPRALLRR